MLFLEEAEGMAPTQLLISSSARGRLSDTQGKMLEGSSGSAAAIPTAVSSSSSDSETLPFHVIKAALVKIQ